jgi:hypothetical protein
MRDRGSCQNPDELDQANYPEEADKPASKLTETEIIAIEELIKHDVVDTDLAGLGKRLEMPAVNRSVRENAEFSNPNVDFIFENPEIDSYARINFSIPEYEGRELRPGRKLLFIIPEEFKNRIVRDIVLRHRKSSKYAVNIGSDGYDPNGAYSRVELHNRENGQWAGWRDPAGL